MKRAALWLSLLLPVVVLAAGIARHEMARLGAEEWRIPVDGFDPRDTLRGLYVRFSYAFELRGDATPCLGEQGCRLCLSNEGGQVVATVSTAASQCPIAVDTAASRMRAQPGPLGAIIFTNRIFVSERSAPRLRRELGEGSMQLLAELEPDGRLVSRRLERRLERRP